jgi:hypothetical protein
MQIGETFNRLAQWLDTQANLVSLRLSNMVRSITWNWSTVR